MAAEHDLVIRLLAAWDDLDNTSPKRARAAGERLHKRGWSIRGDQLWHSGAPRAVIQFEPELSLAFTGTSTQWQVDTNLEDQLAAVTGLAMLAANPPTRGPHPVVAPALTRAQKQEKIKAMGAARRNRTIDPLAQTNPTTQYPGPTQGGGRSR